MKFFPYRCYHYNTDPNPRTHSGVAIFIKTYIKHKVIEHKFSSDTLAILVETNNGPVIISVNYTPPSRPSLPRRDLDWICGHQTPVYLMADLNARHSTYDDFHSNPRGKLLHNGWTGRGRLRFLGPNEGTYRTVTGRLSKPDLVLSNRACYHHFTIRNADRNVSDHAPIRLTVSCTPIKIPCKSYEDIKNADWTAFSGTIKDNLRPFNLNGSPTDSINPAIDNVTNAIKVAKNRAIPVKNYRMSTKVRTSLKFFRLLKILVQLHNLLEIHRWNPAIKLYVMNHRNNIISQLKEEALSIQASNWKEFLNEAASVRNSNPKAFWSKIKSAMNKSPSNLTFAITDTGLPGGRVLEKKEDIEEAFRRVCREKYKPPPINCIDPATLDSVNNFHAQNPSITIPHQNIDLNRLISDSITISPIKPSEVIEVIHNFKNKAPGPDEIRRIHLVNAHKILIVLLTKIFNYALSAGLYPSEFKSGIMIFIAKKDKPPCNAANYRPITLINIFGKIYGKIINQRFVQHMENENLFNPHQFGFRKGRGTTSSLALTYEFISRKKASNPKRRVSVVARDVSGAFDRVWHECLIRLFTKLRLPFLFIKVISHFLKDRSLRIRIRGYLGPSFGMEAGVPQGAPDSPDFFNVSTLPMDFDFLNVHEYTYDPWYCDDQLQVIAGDYSRIGAHKFQLDKAIKTQNSFERTRGIITCTEKSVVIPIGQKLDRNFKVNDNGNILYYPTIQSTGTTKILGLTIARHSFTSAHISVASRNAKNSLSKCYRFQGLDTSVRIMLYKMLVLPILTYPVTPLNTAPKSGMLQLQRVQNKALSFIYNSRWPLIVPARNLHQRATLEPINIVIHDRARAIWEKIEAGIAADLNSFTRIDAIPYNNPYRNFPSSLYRARKPAPPPIFTLEDTHLPQVNAYYEI